MPENTATSSVSFWRILKYTIGIYLKVFPFKTGILLVTGIVRQLSDLFYIWFFAKVLDALIELSANPDTPPSGIIHLLLAVLVFNLVTSANNYLYRYCYRAVRTVGRSELRKFLYEKLNYLGVQTVESPDVQNKTTRSEENISLVIDFMDLFVYFVGSVVSLISTALIVLNSMPFMIPIILLVQIPKLRVDRQFVRTDWRFEFENTEKRRIANLSAWMLTNPRSLTEISVLGAFGFLSKKFTDFHNWFNAEKLKMRRRFMWLEFLLYQAENIAILGGVGVLMMKFIRQGGSTAFTIGDFTSQMRYLTSFSSSIENMFNYFTNLQENSTRMADLIELMSMEPISKDGSIELPRLPEPPGIEFVNAVFTYANSLTPVYSGLNLHIKPGEKIAIVGHNGAGKTTLVKLISRIYPLTSGELKINGININDLKLNDWYKNIGVLFQEYNSYSHLNVRENIYIGRTSKPLEEEKVIQSAEFADATSFIQDFPEKFDQILNEQVKGGVRPSTGQWQKIAIARFFYRNPALVIFDEPTAAIDAVSEYKIFNKIYEFFTGKTVIIISHRFSTVRNADRILVVEKGQIIEEGSHDQLIAKNGTYAHAFKLQAEGYQN